MTNYNELYNQQNLQAQEANKQNSSSLDLIEPIVEGTQVVEDIYDSDTISDVADAIVEVAGDLASVTGDAISIIASALDGL